jgi:hypothetical protein
MIETGGTQGIARARSRRGCHVATSFIFHDQSWGDGGGRRAVCVCVLSWLIEKVEGNLLKGTRDDADRLVTFFSFRALSSLSSLTNKHKHTKQPLNLSSETPTK